MISAPPSLDRNTQTGLKTCFSVAVCHWTVMLRATGNGSSAPRFSKLALKDHQRPSKTIKEHQTVAEANGQTPPGRVLGFDGAEADSCRRLNAPLDNTSGWPRRPLRHYRVTWSSLWRALSRQAETDAALEAALGGKLVSG